jgi:hypothetical protein
MQEDADQFLRLDPDQAPHLDGIFQGEVRWRNTCPVCGTQEAAACEPVSLLQLQLLNQAGQALTCVQSAFENFFGDERADDDFRWGCPNPSCARRGEARARDGALPPVRRLELVRAPQALLLQLKCFRSDDEGAVHVLGHAVLRNDTLHVRGNVQARYMLRRVVYHHGWSTQAGHCWARVRHVTAAGDTWWLYNDALRRQLREDESLVARGEAEKA